MQYKWRNKIFMCPDLKKLELNWGHIVMVRAGWKSGKSAIEKLFQTMQSVDYDFGQIAGRSGFLL
jgi:hypothetical protein